MKKRHILLKLIFILLNNVYAVPPYLMWMLLIRPLKFIYRPLYQFIEGTLYSWLLEMVAFWIHSNNVIIHETGDSISDCYSSHCLVVCNHQSTSDVPLMMTYMSSKTDVVKQVCWIMNIMFKYTNFGWVSQVHHDFFIKEGKATRGKQIELLKAYLKDTYIQLNRKWLILFPEGGFFYKRKEVSKRYAQKNGFPDLNHCSLPRIGALQAIFTTLLPAGCAAPSSTQQLEPQAAEQLRSSLQQQHRNLEWFIDLTILYPNGYALSIFDLICRRRVEPLHVVVVSRKYDIADLVSMGEEEFQEWFFGMWKQKDLMLGVFYKEGTIVDPNLFTVTSPLELAKKLKESNGVKAESDKKGIGEGDGKEEDNHSSDGENGYHGIDTEFMESFKRSWREVEEEGVHLESVFKRPNSSSLKGQSLDQLPHISMNYTRLLALHLFFIASVYLHYTIIKTVVHTILEYSLLLVW